MTDHEKLLVGLLSEADDAYVRRGRMTTLALMAILADIKDKRDVLVSSCAPPATSARRAAS